jgi:hypothetical protein
VGVDHAAEQQFAACIDKFDSECHGGGFITPGDAPGKSGSARRG